MDPRHWRVRVERGIVDMLSMTRTFCLFLSKVVLFWSSLVTLRAMANVLLQPYLASLEYGAEDVNWYRHAYNGFGREAFLVGKAWLMSPSDGNNGMLKLAQCAHYMPHVLI